MLAENIMTSAGKNLCDNTHLNYYATCKLFLVMLAIIGIMMSFKVS